jgi:biotin transport system substrate-specific component
MILRTKDIVLVALFSALLVVLGLLPPIPMPVVPVPLTLQTFGVMLAGLLLGPVRGSLVLVLYVGLALMGLPVLPGGRAGLAVLAGPTAGFLIGMIPGAALTGWLAGKPLLDPKTTRLPAILHCAFAAVCGGIAVVYGIGVPWLAFVTDMGLAKACWAVLVFLPGDLLKAAVAAVVAQRIRRIHII